MELWLCSWLVWSCLVLLLLWFLFYGYEKMCVVLGLVFLVG